MFNGQRVKLTQWHMDCAILLNPSTFFNWRSSGSPDLPSAAWWELIGPVTASNCNSELRCRWNGRASGCNPAADQHLNHWISGRCLEYEWGSGTLGDGAAHSADPLWPQTAKIEAKKSCRRPFWPKKSTKVDRSTRLLLLSIDWCWMSRHWSSVGW